MRFSLRSAGLAIAVLSALLIVGTRAEADPLKCQRTISKEASKFAQAKMKALGKCEESIAKGKYAGLCPDLSNLEKIDKSRSKMLAKVEKACGGEDKICSTTGDNDSLASIGWDIGACPDFESNGCENLINHCGDVGTCLACIIDAAADQAIALYYADLVPGEFGTGSDINKCQIAIGKETGKFFKAKSKILQKCEDALLKGKDGFTPPCPTGDASGKSQEKLAKAEAKKVAGICKKCGGPDKLCDGVGDFTPAQIGFVADCPAVQIPGGADCGAIGTVNTVAKLVQCVDCVTEFKADCLDALGAPTIKPYPDECVGCLPPPASGPCPTEVQIDVQGAGVNLDVGWTGQGHDARVPTPSRVTLGVSNCAGTDHPTCGECDVSGPIPNAGGSLYNNQRCRNDRSIECTSNADCPTGPPDTGPCVFHFSVPLPLTAGGVAVCVMNEVVGSIGGTINVEAATSLTTVDMISRTHLGLLQHRPCPTCVAGICDSGQRGGLACSISASHPLYGDVSFDCPPDPGASIGNLPIRLDLTTGTQTRSLSADSPACRAPGYTTGKCFCDSCATADAEPCASNADCPGGATCGGRRCQGGANNGTPCTSNPECPGGACGVPGKATSWNECDDAVCTPNTPPDNQTVNEGVCAGGPFELFCAIETFRGCLTNADCVNAPGDSCTNGKYRECFTDNGVIGTHCFGGTNAGEACTDLTECPDQVSPGTFCGGGSASVSGAPGATCGLKSDPVVSTFFCVQQTANASPNSASGLPGLGRVRIPVLATFDQ